MDFEIKTLLVALVFSLTAFAIFVVSGLLTSFLKQNNFFEKPLFLKVVFTILSALLFLPLLLRGFELQRVPCSNLYESLVMVALGVALSTLFLAWKHKIDFLGWPASLLISFLLAFSFSLPESQREALPLIPALNSFWRAIHVPALLLSYAFLTLAGFCSAFYLSKVSFLKGPQGSETKEKQFQKFSNATYQCVSFGFPLLTFGIVTGALWANHAWGNLWQWDPKENLALFTWFIYLAYLHLKLSNKASAQTLAWLNVFGIAAIYLTYFGINQFDLGGLHTYGKV